MYDTYLLTWLKSTFYIIVRLNVDSDAKLTDGGNPFHTLTMRSAKKNLANIIDTS